jgi:hypothetical protein
MTTEYYAIHARLLVEETDTVLKFRVWRPYANGRTIEDCVISFPRKLTTMRPAVGAPGHELILPRWLLEDRGIAGLSHGTTHSWHISTPPPAKMPRHPDVIMGLMEQTGELIQEDHRLDLKPHLDALSAELEQAMALEAVGFQLDLPPPPAIVSYVQRTREGNTHPILLDGAACFYNAERELAAGAFGLSEDDPALWEKIERIVQEQLDAAEAPEVDEMPPAHVLDRAHSGRRRAR